MYSVIYQHDRSGFKGKAIKHLGTPAGDQIIIEAQDGKPFTALKEEFNVEIQVEINRAIYTKTLREAKNVKHSFFSRIRIWALRLSKQTELEPEQPVSLGMAYIINEYIKIVYKTSELNRKQRDNVSLAFRRNFKLHIVKI